MKFAWECQSPDGVESALLYTEQKERTLKRESGINESKINIDGSFP